MTLDLIMGPMFAGKSTELLRRVRRYEHAGRKCILIKWQGDTRYEAEPSGAEPRGAACITTHDQHHRLAVSACRLSDLDAETLSADVIAIDEGQFFEDIVEFCSRLAVDRIVIVSCLDGTFEQEPFPNISRLLSKADTAVKLSAVCTHCKQDASFTKRKMTPGTATSTTMIVVGGSEMYAPCCRMCL
jgi:thymidine kinase